METLIETIDFVASNISTKSSLSATSPLHGGGVLGGVGTGDTTHTNPTDILSIPIRLSIPATDMSMITMAMGHPVMVTDMITLLGVTTAAITAARSEERRVGKECRARRVKERSKGNTVRAETYTRASWVRQV